TEGQPDALVSSQDVSPTRHAHRRARLLRAAAGSLDAPLSLRRSCVSCLRARADSLRAEFAHTRERCSVVVREIALLWEQLGPEARSSLSLLGDGVAPGDGVALPLDVRRLREYTEAADELRAEWARVVGPKLSRAVSDLEALWARCHAGADERSSFMDTLASGALYWSPFTLERVKEEIGSWERRWERERTLIGMVEERERLLGRMREFEVTASEPGRLFEASFRLNEEERFRRQAVPALLEKETEIRMAVEAFEAESGGMFLFDGVRWLDTMPRSNANVSAALVTRNVVDAADVADIAATERYVAITAAFKRCVADGASRAEEDDQR
ncbi:carboxypeptidase C prc1, partial [Irineochytrium annulatum]